VASRALRFIIVACFTVGWCGVFGAPACSKTYSCTGDFMYKDCSRITDAATCTQVHGCHTRKPTCLNGCDVGIGCDDPAAVCGHISGCSSPCAGVLDETECTDFTASLGAGGPSIHQCEWSTDGADGGGSCQSVCLPLNSEKSCAEQASAGCTWVVCEGTVKDDCSSYSGDECPTSLGCDRTTDAVE
jgi:hypothetical protein